MVIFIPYFTVIYFIVCFLFYLFWGYFPWIYSFWVHTRDVIVSSSDTVVHASVCNCVNIDDLLFLEKDQLQGYNYPKKKHRKNNIKQHNMMMFIYFYGSSQFLAAPNCHYV